MRNLQDNSSMKFSIPKHPTPYYDPKTGAMFTGARDKINRMIFEGDIVKISIHYYIVYWNEYYLHWGLFAIPYLNNLDQEGNMYSSIEDFIKDHDYGQDVFILSNSNSWKARNHPEIVGSVYTNDIDSFMH